MASAFLGLNVLDGLALGFVALVALAAVLDRFGDAMFERGLAKPFYIRRHRLHHRSFLLGVLPLIYSFLASLVLLGVIHVVWRLLWPGLATTLAIGVGCLTVDLAWDSLSSLRMRWGILHHELIYLAIPAFAFTNFLRLVI